MMTNVSPRSTPRTMAAAALFVANMLTAADPMDAELM
jgi:hypothetical protein